MKPVDKARRVACPMDGMTTQKMSYAQPAAPPRYDTCADLLMNHQQRRTCYGEG